MKTRSMLCLVLLLATFVTADAEGQVDTSTKVLGLADLNEGVASAKTGTWSYHFGSQGEEGLDESLTIHSNGLVYLQVAANRPVEYLGIWRVDEKGVFRIDILGFPDPYTRITLSKEKGNFVLKGIMELRNSGEGGKAASEPLVVPFGPFKLRSAHYDAEMRQFAACPVCHHNAVAEWGFAGSVCKVCFWRSDSDTVASADDSIVPDVASKLNFGLTIKGARKNFQEFGACHKDVLKFVVTPEQRDQYKRKDPTKE